MTDWKRLSHFHIDVLKEIGNIGAAHAATSLSLLLNRPVVMRVPDARLVPFNQVTERLGGAEEVVVTTCLLLQGDLSGFMFFIMQEEGAQRVVHSLLKHDRKPLDDELALSLLQEVGNILSGSYLSAIADLTDLTVQPSVPEVAIDMAQAILSYGLLTVGQVSDQVLVVETCFHDQNGGELPIEGHFFLLPDPESFSILFKSLGVKER